MVALEHGFMRVRCEVCHAETLVAFSWPLLRIPAHAAFVHPCTARRPTAMAPRTSCSSPSGRTRPQAARESHALSWDTSLYPTPDGAACGCADQQSCRFVMGYSPPTVTGAHRSSRPDAVAVVAHCAPTRHHRLAIPIAQELGTAPQAGIRRRNLCALRRTAEGDRQHRSPGGDQDHPRPPGQDLAPNTRPVGLATCRARTAHHAIRSDG